MSISPQPLRAAAGIAVVAALVAYLFTRFACSAESTALIRVPGGRRN
jgi:hypothetical protein